MVAPSATALSVYFVLSLPITNYPHPKLATNNTESDLVGGPVHNKQQARQRIVYDVAST